MEKNPNETINKEKYSPSNIDTGFFQKYYWKVEFDGKLNFFIEIFQENWNAWEMDINAFEAAIDKKNIHVKNMVWYEYVYKDALEVNDGKIKMRNNIIQSLLKSSRQFSIKNTLKQTKKALNNALSNTKEK